VQLLLLDTCTLIFLTQKARLAPAAVAAMQTTSGGQGMTYISLISAWEIGMLASRGRLQLLIRPERWFANLFEVPGVVLAVGLFIAYTRPPFVLFGTLWILLIAFVTIEFPAAFQQLSTVAASVHPELEDAWRILGATPLRTLRDIAAPTSRSSWRPKWRPGRPAESASPRDTGSPASS